MKKNIIKAVGVVGLAFSLIACGMNEDNFAPNQMKVAEEVARGDASGTYGKTSLRDFNEELDAFAHRKLIRSGNIKFETKDVVQTEIRIKKAVRKLGGFISFEQQTKNEWSVRNDLEIRMPGSLFEAVLDSICSGDYNIQEKNIKVKDVTDQYVDTEARIATRKMVEQKYIEHLAKAKDIEDVLKIESKIGQIREEIESAEKRLRKLKDQVSLSTLHVEFYQQIEKPKLEKRNRFEKAAVNGWKGLETFLVIITNIWPMILIGFGVLFGLKRYFKNK
ncbi:DUF4349 domain-containing protein [Flavobacteriales bacterium]|jgi:hypothetical protein|nr:DUF4349 domain-containing protein [Flavobacteriales bacterium]|tara:strand:+ start:2213 stop:3043 length:831 start_codon:yes stop_codon:yes gene_type:complete